MKTTGSAQTEVGRTQPLTAVFWDEALIPFMASYTP